MTRKKSVSIGSDAEVRCAALPHIPPLHPPQPPHTCRCLGWCVCAGPATTVTKEKRIQYARELLCKELLPHLGIDANSLARKAYYIGYMVHRMLLGRLGRYPQRERERIKVRSHL